MSTSTLPEIAEQIAAMADALFVPAEWVEIRLINRETGKVTHHWWHALDIAAHSDELLNSNAGGMDIYFGANPRPANEAKGDACIKVARCLFTDSDNGATVDSVRARIVELGLPAPTVMVHTGHGVHCYWRLADPITDMKVFRAMQVALIAAMDSDPVIKNPERIMRLPGFANLKRDDGAVAELIECDASRVYDLSEISDRLPDDPDADEPDEAVVEAMGAVHRDSSKSNRNGSSDLIGKFNQKNRIDDLLSQLGFKRTSRADRWKRPGKDTAGHSVIVRNGQSFHFSSEDPYNDGKFGNGTVGVHDAFDLYCTSKHYGDVITAVHAVAVDLGEDHKTVREKKKAEENTKESVKPEDEFKDPPIPLDDPAPPELPGDIFYGTLGEMIEAVAKATETPRDLPAGIALAVVATVCQKRFSVRVDHHHFEPLNIWSIVAMVPGTRKSAVVRLLADPLAKWERLQRAEIEPQILLTTSQHKTLSARIESLRAKAAKATPAEYSGIAEEIAKLEADLPVIPTVPRLIAGDVTNEHLGTMMAANDERIGIISDEGGIFETIAGRYSNGVANLDLYLQSYTGSYVRIDRGSRPSVMLDHPALTLGLSPQPDVIKGLAKKPGFKGRGLLDRPLYMMPRSRLGYRTLTPHQISMDLQSRYERDLMDLVGVPMDVDDKGQPNPHTLTLSPEAKAAWKSFQRENEVRLRPEESMGTFAGWGSKLPGNVARIAGLMHCADRTFRAVTEREIPLRAMESAIRLGRLLIDHARIVFGEMGTDPAMEAAKDLWKVIERERQPEFRARDAWTPLRGTYPRVLDVESGFELLIDHNLIAEPHQADFARRGRPSRVFKVHPKIVEGWR